MLPIWSAVFSDRSAPRIFLWTTTSRSPRSAALFVGGTRGSSTNVNRSGSARPSLAMNCFSSGSLPYLDMILLMRNTSRSRAARRSPAGLLPLASSNMRRSRTSTSPAASESGFASDRWRASLMTWAQQRCTSCAGPRWSCAGPRWFCASPCWSCCLFP